MKSEEKSIKAISAQAHGEAADNRLLRQKLREKDELISDLRAQIENLNRNLSEKVSQMADMMDKLVSFMMGRGDVTLSDSLRDAVVSGVRAEYEMRERKLKEEFARQLGNLTSEFEARLAAKNNEINALKGGDGGEGCKAPSTSLPKESAPATPEEMAARNKQLEQQKANLQVACHGQHTESSKYHHGEQQVEITTHGEVHGDETTVKEKDRGLAGKGESDEDVEDDLHYFKRWIFCYYAPMLNLTQFVFHKRGAAHAGGSPEILRRRDRETLPPQ